MNSVITRTSWLLRRGNQYLLDISGGKPVWTYNPELAMEWMDANIAAGLIRQVPSLQPWSSLCLEQRRFSCPAAEYPFWWEVVNEPKVQPEETRQLQIHLHGLA